MAIMGKESPVFKTEVFVGGTRTRVAPLPLNSAYNKARPESSPSELNEVRLVGGVSGKQHKIADGNDLGDYFPDPKGRLRKSDGLHWVLAALFVVADMAGGGIVALPTAIIRLQFWPGIAFMLTMAVMATTSAVMLGRSWVILVQRFPQYRTHCRKPYAEMGLRAMGPKMRLFVSICLNFTQFGASTVFLLLSSKNIQDFVYAVTGTSVSFCIVILVVAVALLPITLLKSPQDFWFVIVLGMLSTGVAVVLICLGAAFDYPSCGPIREFPGFRVSNYMLALGTILFTYGGHSAFPTIQHDMRKPSEFSKSAILAFIIISVFNITAATLGGLTYGDALRDSVINSIQTKWIQQAVNLMITAHCLLTVTLIINPLNQEVEEAFNIPHDFGVKRVAIRSLVLAAVVFVAESVPSFGVVLDFLGGSCVTLTSIVFPCLFYLYLAAGERKDQEERRICEKLPPIENQQPISFREMVERTELSTLIWCGVTIAVSTIAGTVATLTSLEAMIDSHFSMPCYLIPFFNQKPEIGVTSTNCCGPFQNVSVLQETVCNNPNLKFY